MVSAVIDEDTLAAIAAELAVRVRDEMPQDNGQWLAHRLPDPADWFRLAFVLAAAVPLDRSWSHLTAWTLMRSGTSEPPATEPKATKRRHGSQPCGTRAAALQHRYHDEELCGPCREADREYDRNRKRVRRAA